MAYTVELTELRTKIYTVLQEWRDKDPEAFATDASLSAIAGWLTAQVGDSSRAAYNKGKHDEAVFLNNLAQQLRK